MFLRRIFPDSFEETHHSGVAVDSDGFAAPVTFVKADQRREGEEEFAGERFLDGDVLQERRQHTHFEFGNGIQGNADELVLDEGVLKTFDDVVGKLF